MKKKLPMMPTARPTPASAQTELAAKPIGGGSRPLFPTRDAMYRTAGLIGGALLLSGGIASAEQKPAPPKQPTPPTKPVEASRPNPDTQPKPDMPVKPEVVKPDPALANGSIDGAAIDLKKAPAFKVYREGGGIGPAEDMWEPTEVEAFINWTLAKEGKLALKTKYKLDYEGVSIQLDAFDADKKIGYIYVDKLDADGAPTKEQKAKFATWQAAKKVAILFIEQKRNPDQATLKGRILKFVADTKKSPMAPGAIEVPKPAEIKPAEAIKPVEPTKPAEPTKPTMTKTPAPTKAPAPPPAKTPNKL